MLILVKFIGTGNVQRWINLGGFNFQPSEFMKLALIGSPALHNLYHASVI